MGNLDFAERMLASCARAPVRIDLAGGWTDCPPFAAEEGMAVVNCGITRYAYATYTPTDDEEWCLESSDYKVLSRASALGTMLEPDGLVLLRAVLRRFGIQRRGHLHSRCDVPSGGGLGSSAAVAVALLGALDCARCGQLSREAICTASSEIEHQEMGIQSGAQDQYGAAFGGINFLTLNGRSVQRQELQVGRDFLNEFERLLLVVYTGASRVSGSLLGRVMREYTNRKPAICAALRNLRDTGLNMKKAVEEECLKDIGRIMTENWQYQKQLSPEISTATIESIFAVANHEGIFGGKVCGAGAGGCLVLLSRPNREHLVRRAIEQTIQGVRILDCRIDSEGLQSWRVDPAVRSGPLDQKTNAI